MLMLRPGGQPVSVSRIRVLALKRFSSTTRSPDEWAAVERMVTESNTLGVYHETRPLFSLTSLYVSFAKVNRR